ncbi:MAG: undecaprenyl-phosphate glucose phosphotransferase [Desulfarculaceae bacterium]|nr:undecaprenyl-phosphate glucose phosphotransferase [Desulfarculaceae bacterium]MCF8046736.1 undecaprenyl-phosphate glucose phosphotransferase [Desulfarculaceae bacterium]MCF8064476.1 undecaprenyl-phosphate glucose phosphotransferase [Desulfarculaceae bacterium]MCF8096992.1 undecaprenyl-phosphate glucose phosphotransferase [Desulfarculaceae bacterium]MCF8122543.1 undecaprenyl-phosphate glucose phosphotransferase [Desulfarculaceae bacterium]
MFQQRLKFFRSILYLGDLALVGLAWFGAYFLRFYLPILPVTKGIPPLSLYIMLFLLVLADFAVVLPLSGLYRRPWAGTGHALWPVLRGVLIGVVVAITLTWFLRPYDFSRLVFLHFFVLLSLGLLLFRPVLRHYWRCAYPENAGERVLIVGAAELAAQVAANIKKNPVLGLSLVGFLSRHQEKVGSQVAGLTVLGSFSQVADIVAQQHIQVVIIALPLGAHESLPEILEGLSEELVDVRIVPDLYRFMSLGSTVESFEGMPIIGLRGSRLEGWPRVLKRVIDVMGSLLFVLIFSPLMSLIAIGVKLSSPGPALYRQKRMGLDGVEFEMYKFRTMRVGAEAETGPVWAKPDDPRRTRLGAILRRTSLDELPQFFNVLSGEMSLVGPRPERPELITQFRSQIPGYMLRHMVKAGITGWAQINGWRGNTDLTKRIEHDLYYIENWSLLFDIKIILLTPFRGLINPHAY